MGGSLQSTHTTSGTRRCLRIIVFEVEDHQIYGRNVWAVLVLEVITMVIFCHCLPDDRQGIIDEDPLGSNHLLALLELPLAPQSKVNINIIYGSVALLPQAWDDRCHGTSTT